MERFFDRDISWLAFNARVLQEAADPEVPLFERIRFMAIWSNNLDEFHRVRSTNTSPMPTRILAGAIRRTAIPAVTAIFRIWPNRGR